MNVGDLIVRIGADTRDLRQGVRETRREVASLPDEHVIRIRIEQDRAGQLQNTVNRLGESRGKIAAIIALLPILAVGIQTAAGAAGGLASMLSAATVGLGGFTAVAIAGLNDVVEAQQNITKAQEDMAKASTLEEQKTAAENLEKAYRGLDKGQLAALGSLQRFKSFWDDFQASFSPQIMTSFSMALDGLRGFLESIAPAIKITGNAIVTLFQRANAAMKDSDFTTFFEWLEKNVGSTIMTFGTVFGNTLRGVMNLMVAFQPVSDQMQGGLIGMTQAFVQWTQGLANSDGFKKFVNAVLSSGPVVLDTIGKLIVLFMDLVTVLAPIGTIMLGIANIAIAAFDLLTVFVLDFLFGAGAAKTRLDSLIGSVVTFGNALKALAGGSKSTFTPDKIIDVDGAFKDWFGSIGDVTGGLKDAKKASDDFLQSFDEVHNINPKGDDSGGGIPTLPTLPQLPSLPSGSGGGTISDDAQEGTNWIQKLIDMIKQIPPLIPLRIDPPDLGGGAAAVAIDLTKAKWDELKSKAGELIPVTGTVSAAWLSMLMQMQANLNTFQPALSLGLAAIGLSMTDLFPTMDATALNWHTMLDNMQKKINAYQPYLNWGFTLIGIGLEGLQSAQTLLEKAWSASWQNMYTAAHNNAMSMINDFNAVIASYAAMQATMKQPVTIAQPVYPPQLQGHPAGGNQPVMDDPLGSGSSVTEASAFTQIAAALKNFDFATFFKDKTVSLGEAGVDMLLSAIGLKGLQGAVKGAPLLKGWLEGILNSGKGLGALTGFAGGGIVGSDSIVRVGEQGRQEAIIPLETGAMQPFADAIAAGMGGGGKGGDIILQIDGVTFARVTAPYGVKESARIGGSMITTTS